MTSICLNCVGIANATGRQIETECPGHKSASEIASRSKVFVTSVAVSMALHVFCDRTAKGYAKVAEATGLSVKVVKAIYAASDEWSANLCRIEAREKAGLPTKRQPSRA